MKEVSKRMMNMDDPKSKNDREKTDVVLSVVPPAPEIKPILGTEVSRDLAKATKKKE